MDAGRQRAARRRRPDPRGRRPTRSRGSAADARDRARQRRGEVRAGVRRPLRGPGVRADGASRAPSRTRCAQAFDERARGALRLRRPGRRDRARHRAGDRRAARVRACRARSAERGEESRGPAGDRPARRGDRLSSPTGWSAAARQRPVPGCWSGRPDGPGDAAGDARRAALDVRRDGRGARALGPLGEHQGAAGLVDRAVRRARADGDAGRAHPGAPGRDAELGRGCARGGPPPGRHVDPERPLPRRHAPARHHADLARVRRHAT